MEPRSSSSTTVAMRWAVRGLVVLVVGALVGALVLQLDALETSARITAQAEAHHVERVLVKASDDAMALATLIAQDRTLIEPMSEGDRATLLERYRRPFLELRDHHDVTHLHFAVPPATSLLRVHAPDTHGDDLTPYRPMLVEAMQRGTPINGFERGRFGASARAIVPVLQRGFNAGNRNGAYESGAVLGVVDLGFSLDETLLADALAESAVALVTLPSTAVADTLDRDDPVIVASTFPTEVTLALDSAGDALGLIDAPLEDHVTYDPARWRLTRTILPDHLGNPAAVVLVASDISDIRAMRLLSIGATAVMVVLLLGAGLAFVLVRRRSAAELARASDSLVRAGQLSRALRLADTEDATLRVVQRALDLEAGSHAARLLLADSSRAHLAVVADHGFGPGTGELPTPGRCPATRSGEVQRFPDRNALDACPFLLDGGCQAPDQITGTLRCQPISVAGATVGVLQMQARRGTIERHLEHRVDDLVRQTGDHLSTVRTQTETTRQAGTDPLTGVANRRSFDAEATARVRAGTPYAVLFADLDHFKQLNDTHGHEVGDRALRLFAGVLRSSLRPDDVIARFGGEEFVVLLEDCEQGEAREAADRLRDDLALALTAGGVPRFTVSVGVADHRASPEPFTAPGLDQVIGAADAALLRAKHEGRDRVVVHAQLAPTPSRVD